MRLRANSISINQQMLPENVAAYLHRGSARPLTGTTERSYSNRLAFAKNEIAILMLSILKCTKENMMRAQFGLAFQGN
jgi:hypothetical protein